MPPHTSPTYERLRQTIAQRMVGNVITGNGITPYGEGLYSLVDGDQATAG